MLKKSKKVVGKITKADVKTIKALVKKGMTQREVAKKFKVSRSCVYYWIHK